MIKALLVGACFFLTACATTNGYKEPSSGNSNMQIASIKNYQDDSQGVRGAIVQAVDGKNVNYISFFSSAFDKTIKLEPGKHDLVILSTFNPGFPALWRTCTAELNVSLKPGVNYFLQMKPIGEHSESWLTDEHGTWTSEVVKAPCKATFEQQINM